MFVKDALRHHHWQRQPAIILFFFSLIVFLIRIFLRGQILEIDEAEQIVMAQELLPGYPDQPPLYSWLQFFFFKLFGPNLISLALLKSLLIFGCVYSFHQICRIYCQSISLAWCATLSWVFIPAISLNLLKDNTHSILALFAACLTWYWFISPIRLSKALWYAIFGCFIGIGFLSKFNYFIFLSLLLLTGISLSDYRHKLLNRHLFITLLIAFLLACPYFYWLAQYPNLAFRSAYKLTSNINQLQGFILLIKAVLLFIVPSMIIARLFFPIGEDISPQNQLNLLLVRYHILSFPLLILLVCFIGMSNFEIRWLIPILFLSPLLYFSRIQRNESKPKVKSFLILALLGQSILLIALVYRSHNEQKVRDQFLLNEIAKAIEAKPQPTEYLVADSLWLLGNFMLKRPDHRGWLLHPSTYPRLPRGHSLLIWQSATRPIWVDFFAGMQPEISSITTIEDSQNHAVIAGYAYASVK